MKDRIGKLMRRPGIAHIMAAVERYNRRLGPQFAAAVTYFSVLSMVPVLLFAVSMLGMTLTVLRPDWLELVQRAISDELGDNTMSRTIQQVVDKAFSEWRSITVIALLTAAYSGVNWVGNLKRAFRVMWRDRFSEASVTKNFFVEIVENLFIFFGLLLSIGVALAVTSAGSAFSSQIIGWLGWEDVPGIGVLLRLVSIALVLVASWLLFAFLFVVLPGQGTTMRSWLIGTAAGAVLVTILQQVAGLVIGVFSGNVAASILGPVIVVMLMFNVLASIIMMVAAWVGTADTWQESLAKKDAEKASGTAGRDELGAEVDVDEAGDAAAGVPVPLPQDPKSWADKRRRERWAARKSPEELRVVNFDPEAPPEPAPGPAVPQEVAARSVKVGVGVGWGVGAAAGIGLGAVVAAVVGRLTGR